MDGLNIKAGLAGAANAAQRWVDEKKEQMVDRLAGAMESAGNAKDKFDRTRALHADLSRPVDPARAAGTEDAKRAKGIVSDYFRRWSTTDGSWKKESVQGLYHPRATVSDIPPDFKKLGDQHVLSFHYDDIGGYLDQMQNGLYAQFKQVKLTADPAQARVETLGRSYLRVTVPFHNALKAKAGGPELHMDGVAQLVLDRQGKIRSEELVLTRVGRPPAPAARPPKCTGEHRDELSSRHLEESVSPHNAAFFAKENA